MNSKTDADAGTDRVGLIPEGFKSLSRRQQALLRRKASRRFLRSSVIPWLAFIQYMIHYQVAWFAFGNPGSGNSDQNFPAALAVIIFAAVVCMGLAINYAIPHCWSAVQRETRKFLDRSVIDEQQADADLQIVCDRTFPEGFEDLSRRQQGLLLIKTTAKFARSSVAPWLILAHFMLHGFLIHAAWNRAIRLGHDPNLILPVLAMLVALVTCFLPLLKYAVLHCWGYLQRETRNCLQQDAGIGEDAAARQGSDR